MFAVVVVLNLVAVAGAVSFHCGFYGGEREDSTRVSLGFSRDDSQFDGIILAMRRKRNRGGDPGGGGSELRLIVFRPRRRVPTRFEALR